MPADYYFRVAKAIEDYKNHPALMGTVLRDEPGVFDYPRLKLLQDAYLKAAPDKISGINLYPIYANSDQLNGVTYEEYIDRFANELAKGYISYDFYPLYGTPDGETWLQDNYLRNFEIVARACQRTGADMWFFIQTLAFNYICREPNEEDMRWQIFCALSFGTKVIQLFTYGTPGNGDETFEDAMIDRDGQKTIRYAQAQKVMAELNEWSRAYVPYRWVGAMTGRDHLDTKARTIDVTFPGFVHTLRLKGNYMDLDHPLDQFAPITSFKGEYPLLVGCFEKENGRAFTLVNMEDPGRRHANTATLCFDGAKTLRVHGKEGTKDIACDGGTWTVTLDFGEGLFVEIL
jgi:hypothetical protein